MILNGFIEKSFYALVYIQPLQAGLVQWWQNYDKHNTSAFIISFKNKEIEILILLTVCMHSSCEKRPIIIIITIITI